MDDEKRWNPAPQNQKTVENSNVPPSYAHYHMHQGTTQSSEIPDKKTTHSGKHSGHNRLGSTIGLAVVFGLVAGIVFQGVNIAAGKYLGTDTVQETDTAQSADENTNVETVQSNTTETTVQSSTQTAGSVASVAKTAMPAVVAITSVSIQEIPYYFGFGFSSRSTQQYSSEGSGSGIIVGENDDELLIATNNHVVSGATTLSVCFLGNEDSDTAESAETSDDTSEDVNVGDAVSAKIKGTDESNDLAVIAVAKSDIPQDTLSQIKIAQLDTSDNLEVGEQVVAIGNALGYGQSVTSGWISALNRTISTEDTTGSGLIQTDAAINPGNSGGALLNMQGEVIGINSAKFASNAVEGMGYAIPISKAQPILENLMNRQTRDKVDSSEASYLGIEPVDLSSEAMEMFDMPEGVFVSGVGNGTAAADAGIRKGDIITGFDGQTVTGREDLENKMEYYAAGETVDVTIYRAEDGRYVEQTVQVTLGSRSKADYGD